MATTDMYREAFERLKHELTPEEKAAIMKAQGQMKTHLRIGAVGGGGLGYALSTVRRFRGFQMAGIMFGGVVIGSQLGFVSGTLSGINTIKALPNSDHILKTIQTIQQEMRTKQDSRTSSGLPKQTQQQQQQRVDGENTALSQQFEKEKLYDNPYDASLNRQPQILSPQTRSSQTSQPESGGWLSGWGGQKSTDGPAKLPTPRPTSEFDTPPPTDSPSPPQQLPSKWAQLRGPASQQASAWDKIRQDQGQEQMRQQKDSRDNGNAEQTSYSFSKSYEDSQLPAEKEASFKESAWKEEQPRQRGAASGSSGVQFGEDFSRSREDFGTDPTTAAKGQQRTNKYGDVY